MLYPMNKDYNKVLKGDKSKPQISSMIDAQNKFPVSETLSNVHQKRINAVLVEGSNENLRGLCVQDSGIVNAEIPLKATLPIAIVILQKVESISSQVCMAWVLLLLLNFNRMKH